MLEDFEDLNIQVCLISCTYSLRDDYIFYLRGVGPLLFLCSAPIGVSVVVCKQILKALFCNCCSLSGTRGDEVMGTISTIQKHRETHGGRGGQVGDGRLTVRLYQNHVIIRNTD